MCRPCNTVSSATLTTAVTVSGGTTPTRPRRKRAAPTPPHSTVIVGSVIEPGPGVVDDVGE